MFQDQIRVEEQLNVLEKRLKEQFRDSESLLQELRDTIQEQRELQHIGQLSMFWSKYSYLEF